MSGCKEVHLRYWSPKVTRSPFGVRVEGFLFDPTTMQTDTNNPYRSSKIVKCISPRQLVSKTGAIYILDGPIYMEDCQRKGFPKTIEDSFMSGFPRHFDVILREWLCPRPAATSTVRRTSHQYRPVANNYHISPVAANRSVYNPQFKMPVIHLKNWSIKFMLEGFFSPEKSPFKDFGISLVGLKVDTNETWQTCEITNVLRHREVQGAHCNYYLDGSIDTRAADFSSEFIRKFRNGFPDDWFEYLTDYFQSIRPDAEEPTNYRPKGDRRSTNANSSAKHDLLQYLESPDRDFEDDDLDVTFDPIKERRQLEELRGMNDSDDELPKKKPPVEKKPKKRCPIEKKSKMRQIPAPIDHVTAKKGTAKFKLQTDQFTRNFITGGSDDDGFDFIPPADATKSPADINVSMEMTGDESFMQAIRPPRPCSIIRPDKRKLLQQAVFRLDDDDSDEIEEEDDEENDENEVGRRQKGRYVHNVLQTKKTKKVEVTKKPKRLNSTILNQIDEVARRDAHEKLTMFAFG